MFEYDDVVGFMPWPWQQARLDDRRCVCVE